MKRKKNKNLKYIALSTISAIFVLCVNYVFNNTPLPVFDDVSLYSWLEDIRSGAVDCPMDPDVFYVNVAYDRALVPYYDQNGIPLGNIDITDREKLYRFLKAIKQADNYKYVFLDVRFQDDCRDNSLICVHGDSMSVDSALIEVIKSMPRLVVSTHENMKLLSDEITPKTAIADYNVTTTETNFVRSRYLYGENESVALRVFRDINGGEYSKHGLIYTSNGRLCSNSPFLVFENRFPESRENMDDLSYYNLGEDILSVYDDQELGAKVDGKYVVIGDFIEDVHDTYVGPQPGSFIIYTAYKELARGKNVYQWWMILLFGLVYGITTYISISDVDVWSSVPYLKNKNTRFVRFVLSFVGFSMCISLVSACLYFVCGIAMSIWFPTVYFTVLKTIHSYKKS